MINAGGVRSCLALSSSVSFGTARLPYKCTHRSLLVPLHLGCIVHSCLQDKISIILANMTGTEGNLQTLDKLYQTIKALTPSSSPEEFEKFGAFFTTDCKTWLKGMSEHASPAVGRQATIGKLKDIMGSRYWRLDERRVLSTSTAADTDGSKVICETTKRLILHGEVLDPFYETEIVVFTPDGLIKDFKLYCCWSPIASLLQDITGVGPYKR